MDISPSSGAQARHLPPKGKAFAAGWGHPARDIMGAVIYRVICRGGIYAARCSHTQNAIYRANRTKGFPLWGKLSPKVTDEGESTGHFPLIRRASAPPSPKGKAFRYKKCAARRAAHPIFYLLSLIFYL